MAPESLLYLPLNVHIGSRSGRTYAPMLPSAALTDSGLAAYVLTATLGSLKQGLYILNGDDWQFAMPQPFLSEVLIRASEVDVYLGLDTPLNVGPTAVVYKNGILFESRTLHGRAVFCVISPQGIGETSVFLKASQALSGHRVVKATDQGAVYASSSNVDDARSVVGISVEAAAPEQLIKIQTDGELSEPSWNWTIGMPIFNGVDGLLTQVAPSVGYILVVGIAIETSTILISIKQPLVLV